MTTTHGYFNPVRVVGGPGVRRALADEIRGRRCLLVTTPGAEQRGWLDELRACGVHPIQTIHGVEPNPTLVATQALYERASRPGLELIVALGGGSVIDTAKVLAIETDSGFRGIAELMRDPSAAVPYRSVPVIAVPTTAGTGSEVTPWATVWDTTAARKCSLHLPSLWPECAVCDPEYTLTLPREVTRQTALDALSHALESIWNVRSNPVSSALAEQAIRLIVEYLPRALEHPHDLDTRCRLLEASTLAGLAFSNTQTALAHAISYYLTLKKGVVHGIACSVGLPSILEQVVRADARFQSLFTNLFGRDPARVLRAWFQRISAPAHLSACGVMPSEHPELEREVLSYAQARGLAVPADAVLRELLSAPDGENGNR